MNTTLTIDKAGRIVIPKELRDELRLEAGDKMELHFQGEGFMLRPIRGASHLRKEQGVWVFGGNGTISSASIDKAIQDIRQERDTGNRG